MNTDYSILEDNINYVFKDKDLLINALTHTSFANEHKVKKIKDNERLEFVSDDGQYISSGDVLGSEECRELAMNDLWENYRHDHPRGADIDAELSTLHFQCESQIAHFRDRQAFIEDKNTFEYNSSPIFFGGLYNKRSR